MLETESLVTIRDFIRYGVSMATSHDLYFGHGTDNAFDDMRALILHGLNLPYDLDNAYLDCKLSLTEKRHLTDVLSLRIIERKPLPYITGQAFFCGLPFKVDERVLIPRSPIAELIEQQFTPWIEPEHVHRILDLCTGSGCIAIACAYAFDEAVVVASDISKDALDVALDNVNQHGVFEQVSLIESDLFNEIPKEGFDIIVSNPPYVGQDEMASLPKEYRHEPVLALEAPDNGLALVEKMLKTAHDYLNDGGILVVEVGNSDDALQAKFSDVPFIWLDFERGGHGVFLLRKEDLAQYF